VADRVDDDPVVLALKVPHGVFASQFVLDEFCAMNDLRCDFRTPTAIPPSMIDFVIYPYENRPKGNDTDEEYFARAKEAAAALGLPLDALGL
jgi:hypothetical protein